MLQRRIVGLLFCGLILTCSPLPALSQDGNGVAPPFSPLAEFLASPFMAAFDPMPMTPRPPVPQVAPQAPPGMCRWERYLLDRNGRVLLDGSGRPLKEYAIGSCVSPPH